jgi:hypothetical protein
MVMKGKSIFLHPIHTILLDWLKIRYFRDGDSILIRELITKDRNDANIYTASISKHKHL